MNNSQQSELILGQQPVINGTGVDMDALIDELRLSQSYVYQYTRDFQQLDTLVDAIPVTKEKDSPFVGDTTLAGLVRSIPRQSLQQLPSFAYIVNGTKNSIPALLCTYLAKKYVFNEDTFGKGLLSTLQIGTEQAFTHGYAPFMAAAGVMYADFGTTMRLLHFSDTSPEPGITDANESGYHYVIANLTPSRVRKILKTAQNNPNTSWNVGILQQVLAAAPRTKTYSIYESAARQNNAGEAMGPTYEFVTRYETGPDATVITFCPEVTEAPLRMFDSKSKWGYPRVMYLVIDPAALTPFGISRVRLASPNQNFMNIYYANIAAMLLINSAPPILKKGRFLTPVQLKRNAVWVTSDPQADAKLINLDGGALEQFVNMSQQISTQIQNIMVGAAGTSTGSGTDSGFSKTAPGVKQQQDFTNTSTNQITKILENFLRQYALVGLDTLLSEQEGEEKLIVDDETKNAINQLSPGAIGADNKITMNWNDFYAGIEEWSAEVSVSISKDEMEDKKRADTQDMLTVLAQNAGDLGPGVAPAIETLTNELLEDLTPDVAPLTLGPGGPGSTAAPAAPAAAAPKTPAESITFKDTVAAGALPAAAEMLKQAGLPSDGLHEPPPPVAKTPPAAPTPPTA